MSTEVWGRRALALHAGLVYTFLYLPIVVLIIFSFSDARFSQVWGGFTLRWYAKLFTNAELLAALRTTLLLALASTLVATVLGTMAALGIARLRSRRAREGWEMFFYLPIMVPDLVLAIALLMFFVLILQMPLGFGTLLIAHSVFNIAYVAVVVGARLKGFNPAWLEAARDLGATRWQTFWKVQFPLLQPGIIGGALLSFALSLDEFVISFFVTGPGTSTLPIQIFTLVRRGVTPEINALATLMLLVSLACAALSMVVMRSPVEGRGLQR